MSEDDVRTTLLAAGWKQGACISAEEALREIPDIHEYHKKIIESVEGCLLIVTLYDCAVINDSFEKEPWLSYVLAKPIDKISNANALSKNSRTLHLAFHINGKLLSFEIDAGSFGIFKRESLLKISPLQSVVFDEKTRRVFLKWIQRRITQSTFPDAFNRRVNKKLRQLGKLFEKYDNEKVAGFYLRLSPRHEELDELKTYQVAVFAAVIDPTTPLEARKYKKELEPQLFGSLDDFFKSLDGVKLVEKQVLPEGQITLSMLRDYDLWSPEYNSFKSNPEGIPPVDLDG